AFQKTLAAPPSITVTAPAWSKDMTLDRKKELPLGWTGGTTGDVIVGIGAASSTTSVTLACKFPASPGQATIPAAAMAKLPATHDASISVVARTTETVDVKDWHITTLANRPARVGKSFTISTAVVR